MSQKEITVQGVVVSVAQPYAPGHVVTEAEARALNQVRAENIANNCRKAVLEIIEKAGGKEALGDDHKAEIQSIVAAKDSTYEFTLASVGGGSQPVDPLTKECRKVARDFLTAKLKEKGLTQKKYNEANGEDAFDSKVIELADHEQIVKMAKKNLAARESLAGLGDI
jgi:phage gp16-like protein